MGYPLGMSDLPSLLRALGEIAAEAGRVAQQEREHLRLELKPDVSIVTNADRASERFLRDALPSIAPGASVWGEEYGHDGMGEAGIWLVDPVDGTSNFAYGGPLWGNSIALYRDGRIELAAIALPDLGELYVAGRGQGAYRDGQRLTPIPPGPILNHELVAINEDVYLDLGKQATPGKMRRSGAFVIDGAFVATQRYRALIGRGEGLYDAAASILICEELGAESVLLDGEAFVPADYVGGMALTRPWTIRPRLSEPRSAS